MKRFAFIVLFFACISGMHAQTHTRTLNENIRTLRVERQVLLLENGIVDGSNPDNTLHISFDEMSHDVHFYTYTVEMLHSNLLSNEYLQGFTTRDITEYDHSMNTSREYTHYRLLLVALQHERRLLLLGRVPLAERRAGLHRDWMRRRQRRRCRDTQRPFLYDDRTRRVRAAQRHGPFAVLRERRQHHRPQSCFFPVGHDRSLPVLDDQE